MLHDAFTIGLEFLYDGGRWWCTDIGTRTIIAIRLDGVETSRAVLDQAAADRDGWFNGPPYAVAELVFDEYDLDGCAPASFR